MLTGAGLHLYSQPVLPRVKWVAPQQAQVLVLHLTAENVPAPGSNGLHWRVDPLPSGADLAISDSGLEDAIAAWIKDQQEHAAAGHTWVLDGTNAWTLFGSGVARSLAPRYTITFPALFSQPAADQAKTKFTASLPVPFCAAAVPSLPMDSLEVQVVSAAFDPNHPIPPQPLAVELDRGVTATAFLADSDTPQQAETRTAFAKVAARAWAIAKQNGIAIGSTPNEDVLRKRETAITALYNMAQNNISFQFWGRWPELRAMFQHTAGGKCCTLLLCDVQMAKDAVIQVDAHLPGADPPAADTSKPQRPDGVTDQPALVVATPAAASPSVQQERADKLAGASRDTLTRRFATALAGFRNSVPTFGRGP